MALARCAVGHLSCCRHSQELASALKSVIITAITSFRCKRWIDILENGFRIWEMGCDDCVSAVYLANTSSVCPFKTQLHILTRSSASSETFPAMYPTQTAVSLPSSDKITWDSRSQGWNTTLSSTADSSSKQHFLSSTVPTIIHVDLGAGTESSFSPANVAVNVGDVLRFHLPAMNCSLVHTFDNVQRNVSQDSHPQTQILSPIDANGSIILEYLVDTSSPQWVYPEHSCSSCGPEAILVITPIDGSGTGDNRTQDQTESLNDSQSAPPGLGACGSVSRTQPSTTSMYGTGILTDASVSPTMHLPFATSLTPDNFSGASKISSSGCAALVVLAYFVPVFTKLFLQ